MADIVITIGRMLLKNPAFTVAVVALALGIGIESWMPRAQASSRLMRVVVRTAGDPQTFIGAVRKVVWSLDGDLPIQQMRAMERIPDESVAQRQFNMLLLGLALTAKTQKTMVKTKTIINEAQTTWPPTIPTFMRRDLWQ